MKQLLILGTGCDKCTKLYELAEQATRELGVACEMQKITDLRQIMALHVMRTPALVIDGSVKVAGKVPSLQELKQMLV